MPTLTKIPTAIIEMENEDSQESGPTSQNQEEVSNGEVLALESNSLEETSEESILASPSGKFEDAPKTNKLYSIEEVKEASGSFSLLKAPWDGWVAIVVGSIFAGAASISYVISWKQGEYNRKSED